MRNFTQTRPITRPLGLMAGVIWIIYLLTMPAMAGGLEDAPPPRQVTVQEAIEVIRAHLPDPSKPNPEDVLPPTAQEAIYTLLHANPSPLAMTRIDKIVQKEGFYGFIRTRYSCLNRPRGRYVSNVYSSSIGPGFLGPPKYLKIWGDGQYVAGNACAKDACGQKGIFVADMQNEAISFGVLVYDSSLDAYIDPTSTPEFEQEALKYIKTFATYWEAETFLQIHRGEIPYPREIMPWSFETERRGRYEKHPPLEVHKVACDLDPEGAEAWTQKMMELNKAAQ